jgi:hypothetical protein
MINVALRGMVARRVDSPHLPITSEQIVDDGAACVAHDLLHRRAIEEPLYANVLGRDSGRFRPGLRLAGCTSGRGSCPTAP